MGYGILVFRDGGGSDGAGCGVAALVIAVLAAATMGNLLMVLLFNALGIELPGPAPYRAATGIEMTLSAAGTGYDSLLLVSDTPLLASDGSTASVSPAAVASPEADGGWAAGERGGTVVLYAAALDGVWYPDAADYATPDPVGPGTGAEWDENARVALLSALGSALSGSGWTVDGVTCSQSGGFRFAAGYTATGPGGEAGSGRVLGVYLGPGESVTGILGSSGMLFTAPEGAVLEYGSR